MSEVKRLFEFLEFRTLMDRLNEALGAKGAAVGPSERGPGGGSRGRPARRGGRGAEAARRSRGRSIVAAAWAGDSRSELAGRSGRGRRRRPRRGGVAADGHGHRRRRARGAGRRTPAARRTRPSPSYGRWPALASTSPRCSSTRPSPPTCSTRPRPATASATCWSATPATGCRMPAPRPGQLDFAEEATDEAQVAAREALAVSRSGARGDRGAGGPGHGVAVREIENPARSGPGPHGGRRHRGRRAPSSDALNTRLTAETRRLGQQVQRRGGPRLQRQLTHPAPPDPVRRARPQLDEEARRPGFSTDAATLEKLRDEWPEFIEPLLQYREVEKLRSTYGEGLLAEVAPDGRIHATFNQTVARTGRLSSDQPNLHNIPVRSEEGRQFRRAFVPAAGCSCSWPTTTRSSCAASPTWPRIPA